MLVEPCEKAARVRMEWRFWLAGGLREGLMRRAPGRKELLTSESAARGFERRTLPLIAREAHGTKQRSSLGTRTPTFYGSGERM